MQMAISKKVPPELIKKQKVDVTSLSYLRGHLATIEPKPSGKRPGHLFRLAPLLGAAAGPVRTAGDMPGARATRSIENLRRDLHRGARTALRRQEHGELWQCWKEIEDQEGGGDQGRAEGEG